LQTLVFTAAEIRKKKKTVINLHLGRWFLLPGKLVDKDLESTYRVILQHITSTSCAERFCGGRHDGYECVFFFPFSNSKKNWTEVMWVTIQFSSSLMKQTDR
jgi:hypothetical protein